MTEVSAVFYILFLLPGWDNVIEKAGRTYREKTSVRNPKTLIMLDQNLNAISSLNTDYRRKGWRRMFSHSSSVHPVPGMLLTNPVTVQLLVERSNPFPRLLKTPQFAALTHYHRTPAAQPAALVGSCWILCTVAIALLDDQLVEILLPPQVSIEIACDSLRNEPGIRKNHHFMIV